MAALVSKGYYWARGNEVKALWYTGRSVCLTVASAKTQILIMANAQVRTTLRVKVGVEIGKLQKWLEG